MTGTVDDRAEIDQRQTKEKKSRHGGDVYGVKEEHCIDFSANINALGMPESVKRAIVENISSYEIYPDPLCRELKASISMETGIPANHIACGNGAADVIFKLVLGLKPKKALIVIPTFSEYEAALGQEGTEIRFHHLEKAAGFTADERILSDISSDLDVVFLCSPNNPTGIPVEKSLMLKIAKKCEDCDVILVVDECFADFLQEEERYTMVPELMGLKNLVILKAFTKIYAMAGIRLGYALTGNSETAAIMDRTLQPWSVSSVAAKCGIAALSEKEYVRRTKILTMENRRILKRELECLGCRVYDSKVNYLFFQSETENLDQKLREKGILIRVCDNYRGLNHDAGFGPSMELNRGSGEYYRVAVKSEEDNQILIRALKELC